MRIYILIALRVRFRAISVSISASAATYWLVYNRRTARSNRTLWAWSSVPAGAVAALLADERHRDGGSQTGFILYVPIWGESEGGPKMSQIRHMTCIYYHFELRTKYDTAK
jgi:hypothetical protein